MAKNISLLGADYPDVPAVQLPQTGGGTATFYDIQVVDNLNSDSSTDALSAKQGKVLNEKITPISNKVGAFVIQKTVPFVMSGFTGGYGTCIFLALWQGVGAFPIAVSINNGTLAVKNMITGDDFSSANLTFSYSNGNLTISQTNAVNTNGMYIRG